LDFVVSVFNDNVSILIVKTSVNGNNLSFLVGDVELVLQSEHLPPSRVDACSSEIVRSSITLNFQSIVLPVVVSDSLGDLIEPPLLLSGVVSPSLEGHLGVSVHLSNSVEWKLRNDVEWSVDLETELFVKSLGFCLNSVNINNLPSLVGTIVSLMNNNFLSFNIFTSTNIKAFSILPVDKVFVLILEDLPPL
jgi:hypothetical protein